MRTVTRENVAVALFSKLQSALGAQYQAMGRKHVLPAPEQQPALFLIGTDSHVSQKARGFPGKLGMTFMAFIYAYDTAGEQPIGQESSLVESTMNGLIDGLETALDPGPALDAQTLGGIVSHCWIDGDCPLDPGVFGKQGFAAVPIHVLVP